MPNQPEAHTLYFVLSVVLVNCLIALVAWYEIFYNLNEPWPKTVMAIGQGIGISVAATIVVFADVEACILLAQMFRRKQFNQGKAEGREEQRSRLKEAYQRFGIEVDGVRVLPDTPEVREFLRGTDE